MLGLTPLQLEIYTLRRYDGLPLRTIALRLGKSERAVHMADHRAALKVANHLPTAIAGLKARHAAA